jgi:flagellar motor switch protein FliG
MLRQQGEATPPRVLKGPERAAVFLLALGEEARRRAVAVAG